MPYYKFKNTETGEVVEKFLKISEKQQFLSDNPSLESIIEAPMMGDPVRLGIRRIDGGMKETLSRIQELTPGATVKDNSRYI